VNGASDSRHIAILSTLEIGRENDKCRLERRLGAPWIRRPRKRGTILLVRRLAKRFGVGTSMIERISDRRSLEGLGKGGNEQ
jgi:hypothetical protein